MPPKRAKYFEIRKVRPVICKAEEGRMKCAATRERVFYFRLNPLFCRVEANAVRKIFLAPSGKNPEFV
jgi:hypothetical protein